MNILSGTYEKKYRRVKSKHLALELWSILLYSLLYSIKILRQLTYYGINFKGKIVSLSYPVSFAGKRFHFKANEFYTVCISLFCKYSRFFSSKCSSKSFKIICSLLCIGLRLCLTCTFGSIYPWAVKSFLSSWTPGQSQNALHGWLVYSGVSTGRIASQEPLWAEIFSWESLIPLTVGVVRKVVVKPV